MPLDNLEKPWCPAITEVLRTVGGRWKMAILFYVGLDGVNRFGALKRRLPGISESTLSKQLKELVADGFLERVDFGEIPPKVEYRLTPRGEAFVPILQSMWDFGEDTFDFTDEERDRMAESRERLSLTRH